MRKGRLFTTLALTAALTASVFTPAAVPADDADYELVIELMTFGPTPADISEVEEVEISFHTYDPSTYHTLQNWGPYTIYYNGKNWSK